MSDVLSRIDAAVEQRCACGCGAQLSPDGPSAWFAGQDCQHRWSRQHATNPRDVYRRDDAAQADRLAAELRRSVRPRRPQVTHETAPGFPYWCPRCSNVAEPVRYVRDDVVTLRCAYCQSETPPGLQVLSQPDHVRAGLRLLVALHNPGGTGSIEATLSDRELVSAPDADQVQRDLVVRMQQDLFRSAGWNPSPPPADPGHPEWLLTRHPAQVRGWRSIGRNFWRGELAERAWPGVAYVLADDTQQHSVGRVVPLEQAGRVPQEFILRDLRRALDHELTPPCVVPGCGEKGHYRFIAALHGRLAGRHWNPGDEIRLCPEHSADVSRLRGDEEPDEVPEWMRSGTSWLPHYGFTPLGWLERSRPEERVPG